MTEQQRLHHLLDRGRRGVLLPAEGEQLAELVGALEVRAEQAEEATRRVLVLHQEMAKERYAWEKRGDRAEAKAEAMTRAMESTAADALRHRGCHRELMGQCLRAERAKVERDRYRTAWHSARARVKRARWARDSELRWANGMWSDALCDLDRYRKAWKSARRRAEAYGEGILRLCDDRDTALGWMEQEQAHSAGLRAALAKSEQGRRNLHGLLEHHRDQSSLGILRTTRTRLARVLKACARYRAENTRLTAGQCTHALATCQQHHTTPVDGCPYPRCTAARKQT